jgi:hypothetical protein
MKQFRRVSPRIPYDEVVCLTRVDGQGRLFGRSVDLSPDGIYVTCAELCEIGTELQCAVLLPGGPRRLRGRVVRLVALPRSVGIAISFVALKEADRVVLERLVASRLRAAVPATLRVGGFDHDLRCEALVGERTMRVSTSLPPFLRQGADVDLGFALQGSGGDDSGGVSCDVAARGVISRIALDPTASDGAPRLALDVELGGDRGDGGDGVVPADDRPPTGLPRPYKNPQPSVLLSRRYARELTTDAPAPTRRQRPRPRGTAEIPSRLGDAGMPLVSPPARELTLRLFSLAARPARHQSVFWLAVPLLLVEVAVFLVTRLAH